MKRRLLRKMFVHIIGRHRRKCLFLLTFALIYRFIFYYVTFAEKLPQNLSHHPIFEAKNLTEFKEKNNLKLILVWTRIQVTSFIIFVNKSINLLSFSS
jgi:hypothetical protein